MYHGIGTMPERIVRRPVVRGDGSKTSTTSSVRRRVSQRCGVRPALHDRPPANDRAHRVTANWMRMRDEPLTPGRPVARPTQGRQALRAILRTDFTHVKRCALAIGPTQIRARRACAASYFRRVASSYSPQAVKSRGTESADRQSTVVDSSCQSGKRCRSMPISSCLTSVAAFSRMDVAQVMLTMPVWTHGGSDVNSGSVN